VIFAGIAGLSGVYPWKYYCSYYKCYAIYL